MDKIEEILYDVEEECMLCGHIQRCLSCNVYYLKGIIIDIKEDMCIPEEDKLDYLREELYNNYCSNCTSQNCDPDVVLFYDCLIKKLAQTIIKMKEERG